MQTSNPFHHYHHGHQHDGEPDVIIINKEEDDDVICTCLELFCMDTLCAKHFSPWCLCGFPRGRQPWYYGWGFNLPRGQALLDKWNQIPDSTDILLTHCPPLGESLITHTHTHACRWTLLHDFLLRVCFHRTSDAHTFALRALADGVATAG